MNKVLLDLTGLAGTAMEGHAAHAFFQGTGGPGLRWLCSRCRIVNRLDRNGRLGLVCLGVENCDNVWEVVLGAGAAGWVGGEHNLDADTDDTLTEENVAGGLVNEFDARITGVNHKTIDKFHGLCALAAELTRDNDFTATGTRLHDKAKNTVAGLADWDFSEELELEGLALGDSAEAAVLDALSKELNGVIGKTKAFLNKGSELLNAASTLSKDALGAGCAYNQLGALRSNADL